MSELNAFQSEFMQTLAAIQEECVQISLCQNQKSEFLEATLYDVTAGVIIGIMNLIDGYANTDIGKLSVICEKSRACLKENPYIELHDTVCSYLKGTK